jgi:hypothetical protein
MSTFCDVRAHIAVHGSQFCSFQQLAAVSFRVVTISMTRDVSFVRARCNIMSVTCLYRDCDTLGGAKSTETTYV